MRRFVLPTLLVLAVVAGSAGVCQAAVGMLKGMRTFAGGIR